MRIGFVDLTPWDYDVASVLTRPMGGSQSAACYLAMALAKRGHQVWYITNSSRSGPVEGVACISTRHLMQPGAITALNLDALVMLLGAGLGRDLRGILGPRTRLLLWTQHAHDQPGVLPLRDAAERDIYDALVVVSDWQSRTFQETFGIAPQRITVLRNAVAPPFERMFEPGADISAAKAEPPVLAYTSTPFRGLDLLLHVFPEIRRRVPGARLRVFSSMQVYQTPAAEEQRDFGGLYDAARRMEGVEYVGSLPHGQLARALREVFLLAYPNTFPETSCIAVMEAMAAGCAVVTSDLGALRETTAGYALLLPADPAPDAQAFVAAVVERLEARRTEESRQRLGQQVAFVHREYTWAHRAQQWEEFLGRLVKG